MAIPRDSGANACPPEDCGGIGGYVDLLAILDDSKHPEHEEMKEWAGGVLDAEEFDLNRINASMKCQRSVKIR